MTIQKKMEIFYKQLSKKSQYILHRRPIRSQEEKEVKKRKASKEVTFGRKMSNRVQWHRNPLPGPKNQQMVLRNL